MQWHRFVYSHHGHSAPPVERIKMGPAHVPLVGIGEGEGIMGWELIGDHGALVRGGHHGALVLV